MPGSWCGGGVGMVFMLAAHDGSGGRSPGTATPPRPLIRLCDPSLCRATTARAGCRTFNRRGGAMGISVGIYIAKEMHWVTAIDADGVVRIDRKLANTPGGIAQLITELGELGRTVRIGLDVVGGIAGLAEAMLAA